MLRDDRSACRPGAVGAIRMRCIADACRMFRPAPSAAKPTAMRPLSSCASGAALRTGHRTPPAGRDADPCRSDRLAEGSGRRNAGKSTDDNPVAMLRETGEEGLVVVGKRVCAGAEVGCRIGENEIERDAARACFHHPIDQPGPDRLKHARGSAASSGAASDSRQRDQDSRNRRLAPAPWQRGSQGEVVEQPVRAAESRKRTVVVAEQADRSDAGRERERNQPRGQPAARSGLLVEHDLSEPATHFSGSCSRA